MFDRRRSQGHIEEESPQERQEREAADAEYIAAYQRHRELARRATVSGGASQSSPLKWLGTPRKQKHGRTLHPHQYQY